MLVSSLPRRLLAMAAGILLATALTACGTSSPSTPSSGRPAYGGTLRVITDGGPSYLDPVPAYIYVDYELEHAYARQLLSYPDVPDLTTTSGAAWAEATTVVPDMATEVPSVGNGGISDHGLVYTFHIRAGIDWNSSPPRQVTADDFIREFKAFCNPVAPVGNPLYFNTTIAGFSGYCTAETGYFSGKHAAKVTAASVAGWQNTHVISGLSAPSPLTLVVRLVQPASDFLNIMAMPFVSARPAEYDAYLPASAQLDQHMMSDGPYQISSYQPGKSLVMTRNPAWKQSTDPIHHQYVDKIVVTMGVSSNQTALDDLQANSEDLELADLSVPPTAIPGLQASHDRRLRIWPWSDDNPYIIFNLQSPDAGNAMKKLGVRQAIEYAVNKADLVKVLGGPVINKVVSTAIPPGNVGYQPFNLYPSPGNAGDPAKCRSMLAAAGYRHGLSLSYLYPDDSVDAAIFQSIQASLAACGIALTGKPEGSSTYFTDLGNAPQNDKPGQWDMATGSWTPDWFGDNGRTTMQPLFYTNCTLDTANAGCFSSPAVDSLINRALAEPAEAAAEPLWQQADVDVMKDAAVVPIADVYVPQYTSSRVHSAGLPTANFSPTIGGPDITSLWLNPINS
jgi:peptide/nickel transport system substrate-binding protein